MITPHRGWLPLGVLAAVLVVASLVPVAWLRAFDYVGLAVCHRIPARSFFVDQQQLPVCARDTGMFAMATLTLVVVAARLRVRAAGYPRGVYLLVLGLFLAAWAFDGFNSYVLLLRREVFLYEPSNLLRLITGTLMGIGLGLFAGALFNQATWRTIVETPVLQRWRDLAALLLVAVGLIGSVLWRPSAAYGALVALSGGGVIVMLGLANTMLTLIVLRRYGTLETLRQLMPFAVVGVSLALIELFAISTLRLLFLPPLPF